MIIIVVTLITIGVTLLTLFVFCAAIEWDKTGKVPDGWAVTSSEDDDDFLFLIAIGNIFIRSEVHE